MIRIIVFGSEMMGSLIWSADWATSRTRGVIGVTSGAEEVKDHAGSRKGLQRRGRSEQAWGKAP